MRFRRSLPAGKVKVKHLLTKLNDKSITNQGLQMIVLKSLAPHSLHRIRQTESEAKELIIESNYCCLKAK